ncbi:MAG TPA: GLPGLI family protein [Chryseobacterium sp.]|nr:GLPGLI family protein [Chryseobacterium sp.]
MINRLLSFGFLLAGTSVFSQSGKAVMEISYETKMIRDSLNPQSFRRYEMILLCNANESIYFNNEAKTYYYTLSGKKESNGSEMIRTSFGGIPKYPNITYSAYRSDHKTTAFLPVGKYIFSFEEPELKWEMLTETKKIQNYNCRLAKTVTDTGDIFYAWYTEDLSIPEGPFRFKGLSGMVLEVYNKAKTIEISATSIKKSDETIASVPYLSVVKAKTKKQYLEARKNFIDTPSLYNGDLRLFDGTGKEITHTIKENIRKINVFLD